MSAPIPDAELTPLERAAWDELIAGPRPPRAVRIRRRLRRLAEGLLVLLIMLLSAAAVFSGAGWLAYMFCTAVIDKWPG